MNRGRAFGEEEKLMQKPRSSKNPMKRTLRPECSELGSCAGRSYRGGQGPDDAEPGTMVRTVHVFLE